MSDRLNRPRAGESSGAALRDPRGGQRASPLPSPTLSGADLAQRLDDPDNS